MISQQIPRLIVIFIIFSITVLGCQTKESGNNWQDETAPLSPDVVLDLCKNFYISHNDLLCNGKEDVFGPDFFPTIKAYFQSDDMTYKDVQRKLENYQSRLEPTIKLGNGDEYFVSWYDFKGDNVTAIVFFFNGDGSIMKVKYHMGEEND